MKGYSQKDVLQTEVQKSYAEALGNMGPAIVSGGGGASSLVGDMLGLGVGMAAASAVAPQIGGMMQGFGFGQTQPPQTPAPNPSAWDCACGQKGIAGNVCPNCGSKRGE